MKRTLKMTDGSVEEIDSLDTECGDCEFAWRVVTGVQVCALWQARDTWGDRVRECIDAEIKALEEPHD